MPLLDDVVVREFRMSDKQLVTDFLTRWAERAVLL